MGVKGLQYYLEKCCQSASPTVSIPELVEQNRYRFSDHPPIIVVDGSNCLRTLYDNLEWVGGGQLKQFVEKAEQFVQAFEEIGVRLVFFFDGPTVERKRRTWVERRMTNLKRVYSIFDHIASGKPSTTIPKDKFQLPPGLGQLARVIFEVLCGCEVHQSLAECDEEIAEYARRYKAFAILGQDTDYVILDSGDSLYLSMGNLKLETMTTRMYDRWELAHALKLHPSQLPLLATFIGNDIVTAEDLKPFHLNILRPRWPNQMMDFRVLFPNVAFYIRTLPCDRGHFEEMLPEIARKVLGDPSRAQDILASLHSYDSLPKRDYDKEKHGRSNPWSRLVAEARRRHQRNEFPPMVYAIMSGLPFESSTSMEDFRLTDIPSFAAASLHMRQRVYGILLQEKPLPSSGQHLVPEWCMAGPGSLDEANYVSPILPIPAHPGLMALWKGKGKTVVDEQWRLFIHSVSLALDIGRIRFTLPSYLVIPTLLLFYINEHGWLAPWEVDAMLATATCLKHYDAARLALLPPDPISTRGIRVANLIMRLTFVLYFLLAACGYPLSLKQSAPFTFFDGKLFQMKYRQAENKNSHIQLCEHKVSALEDFQLARHIVFKL